MSKIIEPKVFLIGESKVNEEEVQALLEHLCVPDWSSDASTDIELLSEIYGRSCYKSFGTTLNPNVTRVRQSSKTYLNNIIEKGDHVICAVSGKKIPLDKLVYWNVELQEAYHSPKEAKERFEEIRKTK